MPVFEVVFIIIGLGALLGFGFCCGAVLVYGVLSFFDWAGKLTQRKNRRSNWL